MRAYLIEGGERLVGEVRVSGAKNAALPLMAASILVEGPMVLENVPHLRDVDTFSKLLDGLGVKVRWQDKGVMELDASRVADFTAPYELVKTMRASILVLGPLLARMGEARVSLPGGCAIGARPIDLHLKGLEQMGAEIRLEHGYIHARAKKLKGTRIYLDIPTVTGTENLLMAAVVAEGETVIENAAREPEVVELAEVLKKMGVEIEGEGSGVIKVRGSEGLRPVRHRIIPDRIEAGTLMVAAAITRGNVLLKEVRLDHLEAVVEKLRQTGVEIRPQGDGAVRVIGPQHIRSADVRTHPYPGFPTDMQAQFMALMSVAKGLSVITETIFENRFLHVSELRRMGADIRIQGPNAIVQGVPYLSGAPVMATDLRASASLVLAGLAAEGETLVSRIYHLERGYENFAEKLSSLGAKVVEVDVDEAL
ncbi:MAG: UDP-N-acetylglucosamine 1-carboxyvinyltransferase [Deltaproteobacteria bacterium]|nr:MAG: UDP-N-acetylglucosamine 1-carboxyvinyltransferase [Deltaproteobacteria bacterium]HEX15944.1 UDP-N-acetylglucosamine 1-carboxyvinyltransferase [Deltaproteobacteria bacterium]